MIDSYLIPEEFIGDTWMRKEFLYNLARCLDKIFIF